MAGTNVLGSQFETHVQNVMASVSAATPSQTERGKRWYPEAHKQVRDLAAKSPGPVEDYEEPPRGGNKVGTVLPAMARAAGEVAALSPARPAGMRWENNVPAAHQLRNMTDEQVRLIDTAASANRARTKAEGIQRKAKHTGVGVPEAEAGYQQARKDFVEKSAVARAPYKGTPLQHAGVLAIKKAHDIHVGATDPLTSLGVTKERHFAHDLLRPYDAEKVFHGASGTVDEHMRNVMEGPGNRHGWNSDAEHVRRTAPDPGSAAGYAYGRAVIHEAARRMGLRPNAAQPISWIQEKESKPRVGERGNR